MIAIPAVDLMGERVVQLVGGSPAHEEVSLPEPLAVATRWIADGFSALHVIDLDAALGTGDNRAAIAEILRGVDVPVQVGGGVRHEDAVDALLEAGAARVIVGTRAIEDMDWLRRMALGHPGRIVLAADVRDGHIVTHGWTQDTRLEAVRLLRTLDELPLAAVLVTDVSSEGRMQGADVVLFETLVGACAHPLYAAGGISGDPDLTALAGVGVTAAILGMALYIGALDAPTTARSYRE